MTGGTLGFTVGEAVELLRYGKFRLLAFQVQIPASEALKIEPPYPYFKKPPAVESIFETRYDYINLAYFYHWGETSRQLDKSTPKVYYEIHHSGNPFKEVKLIQTPEYREGYYRGNHIRKSDLENPCIIFYNKAINIKLWNATGDYPEPEDVFVEFTLFYYNFHEKYFPQVYDILMRNWNLLGEIRDLLKER
ncbi:unnamed protein product [marine sediment metagenome]|uniref:Uncharacterized protein n=1 Tax=marine sediment metagenome TaxID=412755 RepID=X1LLY0_9ZZZZ